LREVEMEERRWIIMMASSAVSRKIGGNWKCIGSRIKMRFGRIENENKKGGLGSLERKE
jgi:hypothetical protein